MKSNFILLFAIFNLYFLLSCSNHQTATKEKIATKTELSEITSKPIVPTIEKTTEKPSKNIAADLIYGLYIGEFRAVEYKSEKKPSYFNRITISIDSISQKTIYGHSIVAGNARPFQGSYQQTDALFYMQVEEPGDNRYDGKFQFTIDTKKLDLVGTWSSNDKNLAVTKRTYHLKAGLFKYDPEAALTEDFLMTGLYDTYDFETEEEESLSQDALNYNPSIQLLTKTDIENMYQADLEVLRNSIYARHGYSFKNRRMRYLFDNYVDWYIPLKTNILADLTDLEKKNIDLLKRYEKHAEKYYDHFGR